MYSCDNESFGISLVVVKSPTKIESANQITMHSNCMGIVILVNFSSIPFAQPHSYCNV